MLISYKARRYQDALVEIPHTTKKRTEKQNEARMKGPKVSPLMNRFDMVKS